MSAPTLRDDLVAIAAATAERALTKLLEAEKVVEAAEEMFAATNATKKVEAIRKLDEALRTYRCRTN